MVFPRRAVMAVAGALVLGAAAAAMASGGGGSAGDVLNPLNSWQKDTALWTGVVFLVLLFVLSKFAWKPIGHGLDEREKQMANELAAAERANAEAKANLAEYQRKLDAAQGDVREILEKARRDAEQLGREMAEKVRQETVAEKQRALREIEMATDGAVKELAERSATLAVELAGKIVQSRLDPAAHAKLIQQAVDGFAKLGPGNPGNN
jgi:F-type H+-transporting ATPase subunit b